VAAVALPSAARADALDPTIASDLSFAQQQLGASLASIPEGRYPFYTGSEGAWVTTGRKAWVAGLFPGSMWKLYEATSEASWAASADARQQPLAKYAKRRSTTDLGFLLFDSFGNGYRLTGADQYRQVVLRAARSLGRHFNAAVGAVRAGGPKKRRDTAIVDNLLNTELLFEAAKDPGGDPAWFTAAYSNALLAAENNVRPDGSVAQATRYDWRSGRVKGHPPLQAFSRTSTWSRGQAWAIYGFTMAYRETGDPRLLAAAKRTADWFLDHLPPDDVPYWDFGDPRIPGAPRDSSAAAIAASGLLELATLDPGSGYHAAADEILASLSSGAYLAKGTGAQSILLHATQREKKGNFDTGVIEGDYYFTEALVRHVDPPDPAVGPHLEAVATASADGGGVDVTATGSEPGAVSAALVPDPATARRLGRAGRRLEVAGRGSATLATAGSASFHVALKHGVARRLTGRGATFQLSAALDGVDGHGAATAIPVQLSG
jgi:hypothetical protein